MTEPKTFLILAGPGDATADLVASLARSRYGAHAVCVVTPEQVALAPRWTHRVGEHGVSTELVFRDGTAIGSDELAGVLNRVCYVQLPQFQKSRPDDVMYAQAELHALLVSWLAGLRCPVINPATPHALSGVSLSAVRWRMLAGAVGLPSAALRLTSSLRRYPAPGLVRVADFAGRTWLADSMPLALGPATLAQPVGSRTMDALVVGGAVWVDGPASLAAACLRLARAAGVALLRVFFASSADERAWLFAGADALPDVSEPAALSALVDLLGSGAAGPGAPAVLAGTAPLERLPR